MVAVGGLVVLTPRYTTERTKAVVTTLGGHGYLRDMASLCVRLHAAELTSCRRAHNENPPRVVVAGTAVASSPQLYVEGFVKYAAPNRGIGFRRRHYAGCALFVSAYDVLGTLCDEETTVDKARRRGE